jgi:hypothetical protein
MISSIINYIPDDAVIWMAITSIMLFPLNTPLWLLVAMVLTYCKTSNFMDKERERFEIINQLLEDECNTLDSDDEEDEPSIDELNNEIIKLREEIAEFQNKINIIKKEEELEINPFLSDAKKAEQN